MALTSNLVWGKYDASDFVRVPGKNTRNFQLKGTDTQISRRMFDKHYGAVRAFGTNEKKAAIKGREDNAILRPARGRSDARKLSPSAKVVETNKRLLEAQETAAQEKLQKALYKKRKPLKKVTAANFKAEKISRRFTVEIGDWPELEHIRALGQASKKVFSYFIGVNMIDGTSGKHYDAALFSARYINDVITAKDGKALNKLVAEPRGGKKSGSAVVVSYFIQLHLSMPVVKARKEKARLNAINPKPKNKQAPKKASGKRPAAKSAAKRKPAKKATRKKKTKS